MWRRVLLLGISLNLLLLLPAWAELGKSFTLGTFKPYLAHQFNTLMGWRGYPVDLKDPKLYRFQPNTRIVLFVIEFIVRGSRVMSEVFNVKIPFSKLAYDQRMELSWFILNASSRNVTLQDVNRAFASIEKCNTHVFLIVSQQTDYKKKNYYLTVYSDQQTFVRLSLDSSAKAKDLSHCQGH